MKKFTLKPLLFCVAFAGFVQEGTVNAQTLKFTDNRELTTGLREQHRTVATWADLDNNDKMDFYYGGTSMTNGWNGLGCMAFNNGNGFDLTTATQTVEGESGPEVQDIAKSSYGRGSRAFDFDQDGNIDLLIQSRGGNDTGTNKRFLLVKNNGDKSFTESDAISSILNEDFWYWHWDGTNDNWLHSNDSKFNGDYELNNIAVGDYDKDGYPDLLIMNKTKSEGNRLEKNYVKLLHNDKGQDFTEITDANLEQIGDGSVAFADFNNDGWLDILLAGGSWANGKFHMYQNNQDGTFTEVESMKGKFTAAEATVDVLDYNQDGKVDIILNGFVDGGFGRHAVVFLNKTENGSFDFEEGYDLTANANVYGTNEGHNKTSECRDLNGDGWVDFVYNGYSDAHAWNWAFCSSKGAYTSYELATGAPGKYWQESGMTFGDANGDFLGDAISFSTWSDEPEGAAFAMNSTEATVAIPAVPQNVQATYNAENKTLTMTWDGVALPGSNGKAMYNVYIKNKNTGKTHVLVAANIESGFQKAYLPFCSYILTESYTFENVENENDYEVGVQAVSYSYAASKFAQPETSSVSYTEVPAAIDASTVNTDFGIVTITASGKYAVINGVHEEGSVVSLNGEAPYVLSKETGKRFESLIWSYRIEENQIDLMFIDETFSPAITTPGEYELVIPKGFYSCPDNKDDWENFILSGPQNKEVRYTFTIEGSGVIGITNTENPNALTNVYTTNGVCVRENVKVSEALNGLQKGIYIVNGKKVIK